MDEMSRKIEKYVKSEKDELDAKRAKEKVRRDSNPVLSLNHEITENKRLIEEMGLVPGLRVFIKTAKMRGKIVKIMPDSRLPVLVKREDGMVFPYSPLEIEVTKNSY